MNQVEKQVKTKIINTVYNWFKEQKGYEDGKPIPADEIYNIFTDMLNEFGEYCHTRYKGFESTEPNKYVYQYDSEVVCMLDDFLKKL